MYLKTFCAVLLVCCHSSVAHAIPTITAGNWLINPAANQSTDSTTALPIAIMVSGTSPADDFQGVDLAISVAGGIGIQAVDLVGPGTVFHSNNTGQTDFLPFGGHEQFSLTTTTAGTVPANGVLAYLTLDATGVSSGVYSLNLSNQFGSSDLPPFFPPDGVNLVNGDLTILGIPEPGSIVLALFAAAGLCLIVVRRKLTKARFWSGR